MHPGGMVTLQSIATTTDGGAVASGATANTGAVVRVDATGALDPSWGDGGVGRLPDGGPEPTLVALAPGGGVAVAGVKLVGTENAFWAARLDATGHPDPGFGSATGVTTLLGTGDESNGRDAHVRALAVQADGKVLVAGSARFEGASYWPRKGAVVRYRPDASLDPAFGDGGAAILPGTERTTEYYGLALQPDGAIVTAGLPDMTVGRLIGDSAPYTPPSPVATPTATPVPTVPQSDDTTPPPPLATPRPPETLRTLPPVPVTLRVAPVKRTRLARGRTATLRVTAPTRLTNVTIELRRTGKLVASLRRASLPDARTATVRLKLRRAASLPALTLRITARDRAGKPFRYSKRLSTRG